MISLSLSLLWLVACLAVFLGVPLLWVLNG